MGKNISDHQWNEAEMCPGGLVCVCVSAQEEYDN